ncbi:pyridoxamine 5'-phosphate oxidase family protein [Chloroflexota bacterium]
MSGELGKALAQKITRKMPRKKLEEHIARMLKKVTMCTLVTSSGDIPRGTPLEYFSDWLTLYMSPDPGKKTKNLGVNPNVSISIYNDVYPNWEKDWQTVWGLQITGRGELLSDGDPEYACGREVINFKSFYRALGIDGNILSRKRKILKVTPGKIELLQFGLINKGFASRQVWRGKDNMFVHEGEAEFTGIERP